MNKAKTTVEMIARRIVRYMMYFFLFLFLFSFILEVSLYYKFGAQASSVGTILGTAAFVGGTVFFYLRRHEINNVPKPFFIWIIAGLVIGFWVGNTEEDPTPRFSFSQEEFAADENGFVTITGSYHSFDAVVYRVVPGAWTFDEKRANITTENYEDFEEMIDEALIQDTFISLDDEKTFSIPLELNGYISEARVEVLVLPSNSMYASLESAEEKAAYFSENKSKRSITVSNELQYEAEENVALREEQNAKYAEEVEQERVEEELRQAEADKKEQESNQWFEDNRYELIASDIISDTWDIRMEEYADIRISGSQGDGGYTTFTLYDALEGYIIDSGSVDGGGSFEVILNGDFRNNVKKLVIKFSSEPDYELLVMP